MDGSNYRERRLGALHRHLKLLVVEFLGAMSCSGRFRLGIVIDTAEPYDLGQSSRLSSCRTTILDPSALGCTRRSYFFILHSQFRYL
jgi:hypothetical protein